MLKIRKIETFKKNFFNIKISKPKFIFIKKSFIIQKFFGRKIGVVINYKNNSIVDGWHYNSYMSNWILTKLLSTSFFYKYEIILNSKIFVLLSKFLNKNINFKKNDLAILGPWSEIYFHKLNDFILRVIYAESFKRQLILPISLKKTIDQAPFNKIFKNIKFGYISNQNQKLSNLTLLSHIQHNKKIFTLKIQCKT